MLPLVFLLVFLLGGGLGFASEEIAFDKIVETSCLGLENCENEGKISQLREMPFHEIVPKMCDLQLSSESVHTCYFTAYRMIPRLPAKQILHHYDGQFSPQMLKSYFHLVERTCARSFRSSREGREDRDSLRCWRSLSANMESEIEGILELQGHPPKQDG